MTTTIHQHASNAEIIELARKVCEVNSIAFSANDANQALADVGSSDDVEDSQLLDAIGQRIGIRFREVEGSLRDLILSAIEVSPIIVGRKGSDSQDRNGYFVVLRRKSQSKFVVFIDGQEQTVSRRWLRNNSFRDASGDCRWYMAQPMFAEEAASVLQLSNRRPVQAPVTDAAIGGVSQT